MKNVMIANCLNLDSLGIDTQVQIYQREARLDEGDVEHTCSCSGGLTDPTLE